MTTTKVIGGILIGTIIGAAAGVLMAPSSGKKTRNAIARKSKKANKQLNRAVKRSMTDIRSKYNNSLNEIAGAGKYAVDSVRNSIKV